MTYKTNYKLQVRNWLISRYASKTWTWRWIFYSAFLWMNGRKTLSTIRVLKSLINLVSSPPKGCKLVSACFECFEYLFTYCHSTLCKMWDKSNEPILIKNPAIITEQISRTIKGHFDPFCRTSRNFSKNFGSARFVYLWSLNFMKKIKAKKANETILSNIVCCDYEMDVCTNGQTEIYRTLAKHESKKLIHQTWLTHWWEKLKHGPCTKITKFLKRSRGKFLCFCGKELNMIVVSGWHKPRIDKAI